MEFNLLKSLLIFLFLSLFINCAYAAQIAVVKAGKAYIYADQDQTSIIGFVSRGKKIKVGDVRRGRGGLLPIVVSGRIAYISVADLFLQKDLRDMKSISIIDNQGVMEAIEEINRRDNQISVVYQLFKPGSDWKNLEKLVNNNIANTSGSEFRIRYEKNKFKGIGYHFGLAVQRLSAENLSFLNYLVEGGIPFNLVRTKRLSINLPISMMLGPNARITALNSKYNGQTAGLSAGSEISFDILKNLPIKLGGGYYYQSLYNFEKDTTFSPGNNMVMSGYNIYCGLGYRY